LHHRAGARARLTRDFQAVDIESIAKPVTKWAVTVREPGLVPRVFSQPFDVLGASGQC
jgi:tartronate-semialdehyde synthase